MWLPRNKGRESQGADRMENNVNEPLTAKYESEALQQTDLTFKCCNTTVKGGAPVSTLCMACVDETCDFKPMKLQRRPVGDYDILIDMKYCGICHSDLHAAANHLKAVGGTVYPIVPGHELSGVCVQVGSKVTKVKVGDNIGVGCMVDSCMNCSSCRRGEEHLCKSGSTGTYNGVNKHGRAATYPVGGRTLGGYTTKMVVHEHFAIILPKSFPIEAAGPIMCSGVTLYDPLIRWGATKGTRVGVVGIGGLGLMGIKIAAAMGCEVTAISRQKPGSTKANLAASGGAKAFIDSTSAQQMRDGAGTLDLILNTIPSDHDYNMYSKLLRRGGKHVLLGLHSGLAAALVVDGIVCHASKVKAGMIGSIQATQDVINFCDEHKLYPEIKLIPVEGINKVYTELDASNESGVRYVIDLATLNEEAGKRCVDPPPVIHPVTGGMTSMGSILGAMFDMLCCCKWC